MRALRGVGALVITAMLALGLAGCEEQELSVRGIAPGSGVIGGQEPVKLEGTGFRQGMSIDVYFGGDKSPSVVVEGSNRLVVTTPSASKAGIVDVRIQTDQGKTITLRNAFRFVDNQNWNLTDGFGGGTKTKQ
jgi:hypothetical protein